MPKPQPDVRSAGAVGRAIVIVIAALAWLLAGGTGASQAQSGPNDPRFTLLQGGLTRTYAVHLPPGYSPNTPMPAVIYLHGGGGSIAAAYHDKMDQESDKLGFILVIPAGTGPIAERFLVWNVGRWAGNGCCGYAYEHGIDDVGFISAMIDQVKAKFAVDGSRVYATGISNGGVMAYLVGCKLAGKVAAVAPVSPPGIPDGCASSPPVSLIHVHGTGDLFAKYYGGLGGMLFANQRGACFYFNQGDARGRCTVEPAEQQAVDWIKKDRCSLDGTVVYRNGGATCWSYDQCAGGAEVEFCKLAGGGHAWPSGAQYAPVDKIGPVSYDMSFDQIWDFLKRHSLQN